MPHPAQQIVLQEYLDAVPGGYSPSPSPDAQIRELLPQWRLAPVVRGFQALRERLPHRRRHHRWLKSAT